MIKNILEKYFLGKHGETRCSECGTPCQGIKAPNGKIFCSDCYKKIWG